MEEEIYYFISNMWKTKESTYPGQVPLLLIIASSPLEVVAVDFLRLEKSSGGFESMLLLTEHLIRYTNAYLTKKSCPNSSKSLNNGFIFRFITPPKNCMIREKNLKMIFSRTSQTYFEYRTCAPPHKTVNKMILQKKINQIFLSNCSISHPGKIISAK